MPAVVVVGTQWGDEGKGKITDFLAEKASIIARFQGGNNAGHTIVLDNKRYSVHLIPSGIFYQNKLCILGNGMVIDPRVFKQELTYLTERGFSVDQLRISNRAHIILPYHNLLDQLQEKARGDKAIGTTCKGIGPAYTDKARREGIRVCDLIEPKTFKEKLAWQVEQKNELITKIYGAEPVSFTEIYEEYCALADLIRPYVIDSAALLNEALENNQYVLFEGAQGAMLDYDHGTYPFVTSSNPTGICTGAGVGPTMIDEIVGVVKAYTSRVGEGPFPTELFDDIGNLIREVGREYGTTTGRPRRIGWFDSVAVKHASRVAGVTKLSVNSLDVLSGLEQVKICTGYRYKGKMITNYPASLNELAECEPIFEVLPGWQEDITQVKSYQELPQTTKNYLKRIEELIGRPVSVFSVGPQREQTIIIDKIW